MADGRQAEPVLPFPPASRPRRGGQRPLDHRPRAAIRSAARPVRWRGSKLVDGSSVSRGCWRADPDVREAARMTMPARGRLAIAARRHCRPPGRTSLAVSAQRQLPKWADTTAEIMGYIGSFHWLFVSLVCFHRLPFEKPPKFGCRTESRWPAAPRGPWRTAVHNAGTSSTPVPTRPGETGAWLPRLHGHRPAQRLTRPEHRAFARLPPLATPAERMATHGRPWNYDDEWGSRRSSSLEKAQLQNQIWHDGLQSPKNTLFAYSRLILKSSSRGRVGLVPFS